MFIAIFYNTLWEKIAKLFTEEYKFKAQGVM